MRLPHCLVVFLLVQALQFLNVGFGAMETAYHVPGFLEHALHPGQHLPETFLRTIVLGLGFAVQDWDLAGARV